ncbi:hypothetical protein ACW4TU_45325 (plasmid) [Streptomyces sp. QTS52]
MRTIEIDISNGVIGLLSTDKRDVVAATLRVRASAYSRAVRFVIT